MKINNFLTSKKIIEILFIILPIGLLFSNTLSEIILIILLLICFFKIKLKQFLLITKNLLIFLLILFWLYLIINYLINYEKNPSIERTFFFIRFPLYVLAIHYFINYLKININKIFYYWTIILLIIFFDLIFQYFNEKNILGYQSIQQSNIFRLGGFLDDELKIANLIFHFAGLIFSYYFSKNYNTSKNKTFLCLIFLFISLVIIFLTGERSNFITSAFFFLIVLFYLSFQSKRLFFYLFLIMVMMLNFAYNLNNNLYNRMVGDLVNKIELLKKEDDKSYLNKDSHYFSHYSTAYQIYQNNKLFGVGLKNFRNFCDNDNFNKEIPESWHDKKCATHPHGFYFEIISELGLVGLIMILIIFFTAFFEVYVTYYKTKNKFLLFNSLIILAYFIPIPRGSFFNNWNAIIFWTIFSFMFASLMKLNSNKLKIVK